MLERRNSQGQRGSMLVNLIVLIAIALTVRHFGWDRIKDMLTVGSGSHESPGMLVELIDVHCESSGTLAEIRGSVRNPSDVPMLLTAKLHVKRAYDPSRFMNATVYPSPLPPGSTGTFAAQVVATPKEDECRVVGFIDGGKDLGFRNVGGS